MNTIIRRPRRKILFIGIILCLLAFIAAAIYLYSNSKDQMTLTMINDNLNANGIKLGLTEEQLIKSWGTGIYHEGFGARFREYKDLGVSIAIATDRDNDLFNAISQIKFSNTDFEIFRIKNGDLIQDSEEILRSYDFKSVENATGIYANGEFLIILSGTDVVEDILISFVDKDLRDRIY
ncbi:hypothetical protein ACK8P5_17575 [Paenibacillus sp. EC2-1]|uniref:hypothetical protein n=1 Tax=Paenibacillus sp. EC2-1 TaxID=3388665 RepID=UPI003BEF2526